MTRLFLRNRALGTALAATTAMAAFVAPASLAATASPAATSEATSTPVPDPAADGKLMSYVVNAKAANPGQTRLVERAVTASGGVVVQTWPQIGVVIAHSKDPQFRTKVKANGKNAVESVGATRTAEVSEGTPESAQAPWGPGASKWKKNAKKAANGDIAGGDTTNEGVVADPRENEQWDNVQINADQAHKVTDGDRNVLVGVLDSGIDGDHPDLKPNLDVAASVSCANAGRPDTSEGAWRNTTSYHGTHVAGTIAAARNGTGIVGVAPGVRMASVKVVNDDGFIYPEYAICGFIWAGEKKMDVTNNSYYIDPFEFWCGDQPDQAAVRTAVGRAVDWSTGQGAVHAAAAGNSAYDLANKTTDETSPNDTTAVKRQINGSCKDIPAEHPGVVTVSATTQSEQLASFSNRGLGVIDVAAPGRSILSTMPGGGYAKLSGTSMASPHVAGVLALMKSAHPNATPAQLTEMLRSQARDTACSPAERENGAPCVGTKELNSYFGDGIVDALKAVS